VDTIEQESRSGGRVRTALSRTLASFAQTYRTTEGIVTAAAASGKGALIFAAAGNDNTAGEEVNVNSPTAMARGVISCSAAEQRADGMAIASYSNIGATVAAPGSKVPAVRPGGVLAEVSGTSIACAVAAGVAALWWEAVRKEGESGKFGANMVWGRMKAAIRPDVFAPGVEAIDRGLGLVQAPRPG
jgi:subtilisin family serine protease